MGYEPHEPLQAEIDATSSGANTIVAGVTGKSIRVMSYVLSAAGAVVVKWQSKPSGSAVELSGPGLSLAQNGGFTAPHNPDGWIKTVAGSALQLDLSGAVDVGGHLTYIVH